MWIICVTLPVLCSTIISNKWIVLSLPILFIPVYLIAPAQHRNKPLSERTRIRNRNLSQVLDIVVSVLIILLLTSFKEIACTLWVVKLEIIISMIIGRGGAGMLLEMSARMLVDLAELAASYVASKASMWTHYQMKEPEGLKNN